MSEKIYDVIIIGAGISGLMAAYNLSTNSGLSIAIIDKGNLITDRKCPSAINNISCVHCKTCNITCGYSGAGAFSDGKYNIGTSYGGTLSEEIGEDEALKYIKKADKIISSFCDTEIHEFKENKDLCLKCLQNNLQLLSMRVKHYGTDNNFKNMSMLINNIFDKSNVDYFYGVDVFDITIPDDYDNCYAIIANNVFSKQREFYGKKIILATGRNGANFIQRICKKFNVSVKSNAVDLGVRVEMKDIIWQEFSTQIYEPKIIYKTKTFEDKTRMFCFNKGGVVSAENNNGIVTVNGHSYNGFDKRTDNCNFAILSSINFTEPFNDPTTYAESFSKMANLIGNGNVIVQRFGDLIRGRRTNEHRLSQNTVKPTLKATAGDLSLVLPHRILTNIIETIYALDKVAPGTANDDTLLYGIESKYYSIKPCHNDEFMIYDNIYLIGDGSGIARGLSQSAAMGLYVSDKILELFIKNGFSI